MAKGSTTQTVEAMKPDPDKRLGMTENARIIVCDDEEPMDELLGALLSNEGHAVTTAQDGAGLRRLVPKVRPDLVVCDLKMPGETGCR